jgi:hypothetical protein
MPQASKEPTRVFVYSQSQQEIETRHGEPRSFYQNDGMNVAYTEDIALGQDTKRQIADYLKRFPDGRVVGYGNENSKVFQVPRSSKKLDPR